MVEGEKGLEPRSKLDPVVAHARQKIPALLGESCDLTIADVLSAETPEEARAILNRNRNATSVEQLAMMAFPPLYEIDERVRTTVQETLAPIIEGWGLPADFIDNYVKWGPAASSKYELHYEEQFSLERSKLLHDATEKLAFETVRDYLRS